MSDTEDILAIEDPSDLTVVQLKKILSANNVQLPMKNEKKQVYVDLANQLKASKLKASKKRNEPEDQSESKTTPKKAKTDKKTDSAKKRRKSNPFQSGGESPDEEEEEEEKPKKRTSTKPKSEESTTPTRTTRSAVPDSEKKDLNNSINNNNNNATVAIATVVDTVVATTTPTRRSIREETKTEVTTVAPVSPSRTRRSARLSEVPQPSAAVTPTRRSRVSAALTTSENSIASSTVIPEPESGTRRRRYSEGRATETPSISTDGTDWRARREERRKARETGTTPPRGEEGPKYSVPMTSAEDAAKFLGTSPIKPPVAPVTSTEPGVLVTDENESIGNWISTILVGVLLALLAGAAIYFFVIPFLPKPFCDSGAEITENCIPCPDHGTCGNGTLSCDVGYIRYGAQCIPDKNIDKNAQKILAEIEEILARQHGYHECLYTETPYIPEDILYGMVFAKGIVSDEPEFQLAWEKMNNELLKTSTTITRSQQREYASSEIKKPLSCKVKEFAAANVLQISAFVAILFGIWYFISLRREREEEKLLAVQLADQAKHRLHEQQVQSRLSSTSGVTVEPYIAVLHLRDELTDTMSKKKRDRVWREVEAAIHSDARVQETSLLFHGEQQTMWEWTGPVKLPSDIFSPGRTPTRGNVEDFIRPAVFDEGSSSALDHKYPGLFAPRQFQ